MAKHDIIHALRELGYWKLHTFTNDKRTSNCLEEVHMYTNGQYVHSVFVYANGETELYLQAGASDMDGPEQQIQALWAFHQSAPE